MSNLLAMHCERSERCDAIIQCYFWHEFIAMCRCENYNGSFLRANARIKQMAKLYFRSKTIPHNECHFVFLVFCRFFTKAIRRFSACKAITKTYTRAHQQVERFAGNASNGSGKMMAEKKTSFQIYPGGFSAFQRNIYQFVAVILPNITNETKRKLELHSIRAPFVTDSFFYAIEFTLLNCLLHWIALLWRKFDL